MKIIKYLIEFIFIIILLCIFKIIGLNLSRKFSSKLFSTFGPKFRSKKIIENNISLAFPNSKKEFKDMVMNNMWMGRVKK